MSDSEFYKEWKKELASYSVYLKAAIALLISLAIFFILFTYHQTFYLATIMGGALSGIFGIITVMAQDVQSRKKVAKIRVDVLPEIYSHGEGPQTWRVRLGLVQMNIGVRAGNKVMTFIRLYIKITEGKGLPDFSSTGDLVDISDVNNCPFPAGDGQIMIKIFKTKQDSFGVRYPGIGVPIGKIGVDEDFIKNYHALTLEVDAYEEYTHFNRKFLISWKSPPVGQFPAMKVLSEKFEHY